MRRLVKEGQRAEYGIRQISAAQLCTVNLISAGTNTGDPRSNSFSRAILPADATVPDKHH
jgi:hypothetical protein